jgi:hypothetical protein
LGRMEKAEEERERERGRGGSGIERDRKIIK